ncbi:MAG TPA: hypothetical protein VE907_19675 [Gammaproteobacteria bacterium]|nr:hypothetical protein [Gammaproteobacteria bacterium]
MNCSRCSQPVAEFLTALIEAREGGQLIERIQIFALHRSCAIAQAVIEQKKLAKKYGRRPGVQVIAGVERPAQ